MATLKEEFEGIVRALRDSLDFLGSSGVHSLYSREPGLEEVAQEALECRRCALGSKRSGAFFGAGDRGARVAFVAGDHPRPGGPFEGEEGALFRNIINAMKLKEDEVYVTYALKCAPGKEGEDLEAAIAECAPMLRKQLRALAPEIVVTFGPLASRALLGEADVKRIRGRFHDCHGMKVMPTYALDSLLEKRALKGAAWKDMQEVMAELKKD